MSPKKALKNLESCPKSLDPSLAFWEKFSNFALFPVNSCRHANQKAKKEMTKILASGQNPGLIRAVALLLILITPEF